MSTASPVLRQGSAPLGGNSSALSPFSVAKLWRPPAGPLPNAMTCDVEDYFQVSAFERWVPRDSWKDRECRIPRNVDRVLELFDAAGVKGTFFTLGWVAENMPNVVRRIVAAGHELASHGMCHIRVHTQQRDEFRDDVVRAKQLLEDTSGQAVLGYRAASWSIDQRTPWVYEVLREAGYRYSSSLFPVTHDLYGMPEAPAVPFYGPSADLLEIPATTLRFAGRNWAVTGGGYFRLFPLSASLFLARRAQRERGVPVVFYFHPWEVDPDQPRIAEAGPKARFRHYVNLGKVEQRLKVLLEGFTWDRMDRIYCQGA